MATYELMFILRPDLRESEVKKKVKELEDSFTKAGAKITETDLWEKQKLAYRVAKQSEGVYCVYNFEAEAPALKEIQHMLRIEKDILRSLVVSLPKDYKYTRYDVKSMAQLSSARAAIASAKKETDQRKEHKEKLIRSAKAAPKEEKKPTKELSTADLDKELSKIIGGSDIKV